jgi:hypothetical protein
MIQALKLYNLPEEIEKTVDSCIDLGINTLFLGRPCIDSKELVSYIRKKGLQVGFVETVFLVDENYPVEKLAITKEGRPAIDSWLRYACPSDADFLSTIYEKIAKDAQEKPDYMSLDFIRFFQFWEMISLPKKNNGKDLVETCFCSRCKEKQKDFASLGEWRIATISSIVQKARQIINETSPHTKLGVHTVPWKKTDFENARETVLGQSLQALLPFVDYVSPMMYYQMIDVEASYIEDFLHSYAQDIKNLGFSCPILSSIQVKEYYHDTKVSAEDFETTLKASLAAPSQGVMLFQLADILEDEEKKQIVKTLL